METAARLNEYLTSGVDDLPPSLLRRTTKVISGLLEKIFQESLSSEEASIDIKNANVTRIHNKVAKEKPLNCHPISLTSLVCDI